MDRTRAYAGANVKTVIEASERARAWAEAKEN